MEWTGKHWKTVKSGRNHRVEHMESVRDPYRAEIVKNSDFTVKFSQNHCFVLHIADLRSFLKDSGYAISVSVVKKTRVLTESSDLFCPVYKPGLRGKNSRFLEPAPQRAEPQRAETSPSPFPSRASVLAQFPDLWPLGLQLAGSETAENTRMRGPL